MTNRRTFLAGMLAASVLPKPTWAEAGNPAYLSAGMNSDGQYLLCGLRADGHIAFEMPLPTRGHAAAAHPTRAEAVAFARRPGTFAIVLDCVTGRSLAELASPADRHFYGHGAFSPDGSLLFTTENDYATARGMVGIWDAANGYARIGECASGGIGPHDMKLMPDGETLVIANGGIETHPESGRTKLNIPTMRPNLTYVGLDGQIAEQMELEPSLHKNSIRHLAVTTDGTVAFAMQWQGDVTDEVPLLGLHRPSRAVRLAHAPKSDIAAMRGYAGSIATFEPSGTVAITSPRGGLIQVYDLASATLSETARIEDVCGVARGTKDYFVTSGIGLTMTDPTTGMTHRARHDIQWDNHLIEI